MADDPKKDDDGLSDTAKAMRNVEPFLSAAWRLVGGCVVGVVGGLLVDRWLGTKPWGLIILSMVGIVIGFWGLIVTMSKLDRKKP
ncbi:MAG: AtpZ/AtpI family protein [Myxococcaceae bacterium]